MEESGGFSLQTGITMNIGCMFSHFVSQTHTQTDRELRVRIASLPLFAAKGGVFFRDRGSRLFLTRIRSVTQTGSSTS